MQTDESEGLNEKYIKKLNEIIELFKIEKETGTFYMYIGKEDSKFNYNIFLSLAVILIAVITAISNIIDKQLNILILIFFATIMLLIGFYIIIDSRSSKKMNMDFIHEFIKFNVIISYLQSLKILPYEVDLSKLIDKIKNRYHILCVPSFLIEKYHTKIWFKEIDDCLDEINKEILEKEKKLGTRIERDTIKHDES